MHNITIKDIGVSDITLVETIKNNKEITFVFPKMYLIKQKKYIENCALKISNWKELRAIVVTAHSSTSFSKKEIDEEKLENFDLIQGIDLNDTILTLIGYSRDSNDWLEYSFINSTCEIIIPYQ